MRALLLCLSILSTLLAFSAFGSAPVLAITTTLEPSQELEDHSLNHRMVDSGQVNREPAVLGPPIYEEGDEEVEKNSSPSAINPKAQDLRADAEKEEQSEE